VGDVMMVEVGDASARATVTGTLGRWPLVFAPDGGRHVALVGLDVDMPPGIHEWRVEIREAGGQSRILTGRLGIAPRMFDVQRLTLPPGMVDLDPATERRANAETARLRELYRTFTPERLWRDAFTRPLAGDEPGTGFGARRIINGQPRAPHTGADYAAAAGTPVFAANAGRVALVDEFFFPGRLVVIDHGLGLYTLYFHLDTVGVIAGQAVERGQGIGTVGATGRATGPHLHFGAQVGEARVDPASLFDVGGLDAASEPRRTLGSGGVHR
jgi:murein DD-endopeptidase MepM/ murein hydrolase activator NlpD